VDSTLTLTQRDCPTTASYAPIFDGRWVVWRLFGPPDRRFVQLKLAGARVPTAVGERSGEEEKIGARVEVLGHHPRPDRSELVFIQM